MLLPVTQQKHHFFPVRNNHSQGNLHFSSLSALSSQFCIMAAPKSFLCANCGAKVLTDLHTCMKCYYAPKYKDGESVDVYCDQVCQQGHLTSHQAHCQLRISRENLFRAAILMKATFMTFRECLYGRPLVEMKVYNGELLLLMDPTVIFHPWYYPFPDDVTTDPKHKEAALSLQNCNAAANICGGLAKRLLEGK